MGTKDLYILTAGFPVLPKSEPYLYTESVFLKPYFKNIYFIPVVDINHLKYSGELNVLQFEVKEPDLKSLFFVLKKTLSDLMKLLKKVKSIRIVRYYVSDLRKTYKKALSIEEAIKLNGHSEKIIIYAYWSNECASIAAILKMKLRNTVSISRAHGFDVFEEQTKHHIVPFRKFQLAYINKMYSVSRCGEEHLKKVNPDFSCKITRSYLGSVNNDKKAPFSTSEFVIVTCCYIRPVKQLSLLPDILQHIPFNVKWFVIGGGDENEISIIQNKTKFLPKNIEVNFLGHLNEQELHRFYQTQPVSLLISLSRSEGLPYSMMEAISYGIPLLSTNVGGCNEICNENTGLLVEQFFKPIEVAELIANFSLSEKNSLEFRKKVRDYWEQNFKAENNYHNFATTINEL